jgi:hypothetical protein
MFAIKQLLRGFASPADRAKMAAEDLGLAVDCTCPNKSGEAAYLSAALEECATDVTRMLHREYDSQFIAQDLLPGGRRKYAVLERSAGHLASPTDTIEHCEQMLDVFEEEWELNYRSPFASAFYGTLLANTALAWRGNANDDNILDPRWQNYQDYCAQARAVFLDSAPKPDQCPYWHRMYFALGAIDGSIDSQMAVDLQARFEQAVAFDPLETELYAIRMGQLVRGAGLTPNPARVSDLFTDAGAQSLYRGVRPVVQPSYADMDAFALESIHATRSEIGTAIYAMLYSGISGLEPLSQTQVNYNILRNSFFDWSRKNKSQYVVNALVSAAYDFEDFDTINSMLSREWTEFHPEAWGSADRATEALDRLVKRRSFSKAKAA